MGRPLTGMGLATPTAREKNMAEYDLVIRNTTIATAARRLDRSEAEWRNLLSTISCLR